MSGPRTRNSRVSRGLMEATRKGAAVTVEGVVPRFTSCEASRSKSSWSRAGVAEATTSGFASSSTISSSTIPTASPFASTTLASAGKPSTSTLTAASEKSRRTMARS